MPDGETNVAIEGLLKPFTVKFMVALMGPFPAEFHVRIAQDPAPLANAVAGVTEHVPEPELQFA